MKMTNTTVRKIYGIILFAGIVFFLILNYRSVGTVIGAVWGLLLPFVMGAVMAFIINIPMTVIENRFFRKWAGRGFVRPVCMIVTLLIVALVIAGVLTIVVPQLGTTINQLVASLNASLPALKEYAENLFKNNAYIQSEIESLDVDANSIINVVTGFVRNGAVNAFGNAFSAAKAALSVVTSTLIGFVFACYILMQKEHLARQAVMLVDAIFTENAGDRIKYLAKKCSDTFSNFISCQCLEACILGAMFLIVLLITGIPYAVLISVLITFTALIPVVGAFIGCAVGAFLILMDDPFKALVFIIIFLVIQQIEGNLIYPKVVGGSVGLPSMWVLFAVTDGSSLMGVAGMLFFIPLTSVVYSIIKEWTYARLEKKRSA